MARPVPPGVGSVRQAQVILEDIRRLPTAGRFGPLIKDQVDLLRGWVELALIESGREHMAAEGDARLVVVALAKGETSVASAILAVRADRAAR